MIDRFEEEYGALDCLRLRYNRVQRAVDFLDPDARLWELLFAVSQKDKCGAFSTRDPREVNHPVIKDAIWGAEGICDLLAMDPLKRKGIPPDLQSPDVEEIEKKIDPLLREMGRPCEKVSCRPDSSMNGFCRILVRSALCAPVCRRNESQNKYPLEPFSYPLLREVMGCLKIHCEIYHSIVLSNLKSNFF